MKIKNVLIIFLILTFAVVTSSTAMTDDEAITEARKAEEAFRNANAIAARDTDQAKDLYSQAILHYEKIINVGRIKNAPLYYNLANAHLLKGDLGKAIINYLRAEKLEPANSDIQKNLAFARSRRIDTVQIKTKKRVLHTLFFWHYDFSINTRFFLACLSFATLFTALTLIIWFRKRPTLIVVSVITGFLLLCFSISVAAETIHSARQTCGVIIADSVIARQGDGQNYPPSFKDPLHEGTEFELLEKRPNWLHIKLADDSKAWIKDSTADLL